MYRFLLSRQWVILTLLGLALIPAMTRLGFWQLHRHEARVAHNELIASSLAAPAVPFDRLTGTKRGPAEDDLFRTAKATGRYDTDREVVVRQRTGADEQSIGYFVVTPLIRDDGSAVLVNRGWIEAEGDLTRFPDVPAPPRGEVTVTGRVMADETSEASGIKDKAGLPPRQVMLIDSRQLARKLDRPVLRGHLQLTGTSPKPGPGQPEKIPEPDHSSIGPHMAYAVQWWVFAAGVPVGWVVLVRRERRDRLAAATASQGGGGEAAPAGPADPEDAPDTGAPEPDERETREAAGEAAAGIREADVPETGQAETDPAAASGGAEGDGSPGSEPRPAPSRAPAGGPPALG